MNKRQLRKIIITLRNELSTEDRVLMNKKILNNIKNNNLYKEAKSIFCFIGFGSEVDTTVIIKDALEKGKKVYVPKIENKKMKIINIKSLDNLKSGVFGILEPESGEELIGSCDLILVPGVAFTIEGDRLGYGGGYYDKYIHSQGDNIKTMAIAYSIQIVNHINTEEFDKKINYLLTEKDFYHCYE